jgi:hypothetical protein
MKRLTLAVAALLALPAGAAAHGPPVVSGGPTGVTRDRTAEFTLAYDEPVINQSFECKLDAQDWQPCTESELPEGKAVYADLADGEHAFQARRVLGSLPVPDPTVDETPSTPRKWTVDTTAPKTTLGLVAEAAEFSADEAGATFECSLDGAAFAACASPFSIAGLAAGDHKLAVRGADAVGNVEAVPAEVSWNVAPPPAPATPAESPAPAAPATTTLTGLPPGTMPLITVGRPVKRPKAVKRGCAAKRTAKQRAACRRKKRRR